MSSLFLAGVLVFSCLVCQISWVRSVRSGFGCFKVLKKNKGFLLKLKGLPKPKKEKPRF